MVHTQSSTKPVRPFLKGLVVIHSESSIESLGKHISSILFKGIAFGGRDDEVFQEVPALFVDVLGLRFVLSGYAGKHYVLECFPSPDLPPFGDSVSDVDISDHLRRSLGCIENATIALE